MKTQKNLSSLVSNLPMPSISGLLAAACEAMDSSSSKDREDGAARTNIATFVCDVTPPLGHPLCGGLIKPLAGIDDPELAKGVILRCPSGTCVLCAVDWASLENEAYYSFRQRIAEAARTGPSRVARHCVNQHDAPAIDTAAQRLIGQVENGPLAFDAEWVDRATSQVAASVCQATARWRPVTHVGTGRAIVKKVASTRRIKLPDGSVRARYSSTTDPSLRQAPEGKVDPWLRTISFYDGENPIARLHYYASHPQSYYGKGRATFEFPGMARERLEKETGVFQVYFTGCAGDVAAGKYNDGSHARRQLLADRIYRAMVESIAVTERRPVGAIGWKTRKIRFQVRKDVELSESALWRTLHSTEATDADRLEAAFLLASVQRVRSGRPFQLSCLSIGSIRILHLPGEPFVEFQLEAQRLRPDRFVAVAGYSDRGLGYVCTDEAYSEGGYEPTASTIGPPSEEILKRAIAELLTDDLAL